MKKTKPNQTDQNHKVSELGQKRPLLAQAVRCKDKISPGII